MSTGDVCSELEPLDLVALFKLLAQTILEVVLHLAGRLPHFLAFVVELERILRQHRFWQN